MQLQMGTGSQIDYDIKEEAKLSPKKSLPASMCIG